LMRQAGDSADELNIAIVTGHTGTYESLLKIVGVCTAYGTVTNEKLITPGNARAGDCILCTKPIGLEILVNFAQMHRAAAKKLFGIQRTEKLTKLVHMQSCVKEALQLAETGNVHAMHDATEGGLVVALNEMAEASGLGFTVQFEKMPINSEVRKMQKKLQLSDEQVLSMSSTGTIIAAADAQAKNRIEKILLENGLATSFIGAFTESKARVLMKNNVETPFPQIAEDPYNRILLTET